MKIFQTIIMTFLMATSVLAQELETNASPIRPLEVETNFEENDFAEKPWIAEFRYVVVVNKATKGKEAQTIKVYENGQLISQEKVSTGRDGFERKGEHYSKRDSWTITPTGYYTPTWLSKEHRSSAYGGIFSSIIGGTKMPFAIFFNGDIALHEAPKGTSGDLGKKASGGCIRLPKSLAADLFQRIQETKGVKNPKFTVAGEAMLDEAGRQLYSNKSGYSALIIVLSKEVL